MWVCATLSHGSLQGSLPIWKAQSLIRQLGGWTGLLAGKRRLREGKVSVEAGWVRGSSTEGCVWPNHASHPAEGVPCGPKAPSLDSSQGL